MGMVDLKRGHQCPGTTTGCLNYCDIHVQFLSGCIYATRNNFISYIYSVFSDHFCVFIVTVTLNSRRHD